MPELLFYGGSVLMAVSAVAAAVCAAVFHARKKQLNAQLDREYGKRPL